jgi:hypothetical protein
MGSNEWDLGGAARRPSPPTGDESSGTRDTGPGGPGPDAVGTADPPPVTDDDHDEDEDD